ncbi:MAG: SUF system NifU family Fe-S cluster assembly protein [Gorillibacterium sp.]|nr:SUF system NifU family Fe-S cluster assembly protein [Gorillibacterium sp.]
MSLDQMYSEIIMEHNKSGHNKKEMIAPDVVERGHNPNCGDDLTLLLKHDGETITQASFLGSGCAISQASMSIMIDLIKGKKLEEVQELTDVFMAMIHKEALEIEALEKLEDAAIFENLSNMPARVKCGTLGWHCLKVSLQKIEQ